MQKMLSYLRQCTDQYQMIGDGDRIAVGVSGGKDSLTLLLLMSALREFYPRRFTLEAITLDMGGHDDFSPIAQFCETIGVRYTIVPTQIRQIVFDVRKEKNPCALCAKLRRGALNDAGVSLGCSKVALGHHFDDAVETFLLSLFYEGRISCFEPVTHLERTGLTVIRPLLYMKESEIVRFASRQALPICKSTCPADKETRREEIKTLVRSLEKQYRCLREHIFGAMQRYPLEGWAPIDPRAEWLKAHPAQKQQRRQAEGASQSHDGGIDPVEAKAHAEPAAQAVEQPEDA